MNSDFPYDDDERTAVVSLTELKKAHQAKGGQLHHLLVHVQGSELGRVRKLEGSPLLLGRGADAEIWIGDDGVSRKHARLIADGDGYRLEDLGSANGTFVQGVRLQGSVPLKDGDQVQLGPAAVFRYSKTDDDQKNLLEQLYSTSVTDALTGARNREYLDSLLVSELSWARRHEQPVSFVMFDLDHFKRVNDTFGHPAGDAVLKGVAAAVRRVIRAEDALCRYGGEEFGLVLRGIDLTGAAATGERLRALIGSLGIAHEGQHLTVTASVGCACGSEIPECTPQALIELADKRLYTAKKTGRNRVVSAGDGSAIHNAPPDGAPPGGAPPGGAPPERD